MLNKSAILQGTKKAERNCVGTAEPVCWRVETCRITPDWPFKLADSLDKKNLMKNITLWFSLCRMKMMWTLTAQLEPLLHRWSGSTGCSTAVGSCWQETQSEAGTLPPMACRPNAPRRESVGSGEGCLPTMGPTNRSMKLSPKVIRGTPSALPSTACWLSSPWTCSSSSTGQISTCASTTKEMYEILTFLGSGVKIC